VDILHSLRREHVRERIRQRGDEVLALPTSCPHRWDAFRRTTTGDLWFFCNRCSDRQNWTRARRKADAQKQWVETGVGIPTIPEEKYEPPGDHRESPQLVSED
jgi:hypothetical protein